MNDIDREILAENELEERRRRGMIFLPNAITTGAMFCGFYSIMQAMALNFDHAVWAIFAAGIFDLLDGRVARITKSTSAFGSEYDSFSDLISFGFAPAILMYFWALQPFGKLGWAVAFLYLACTAIRLAKFNTLAEEEESRRYFRGLCSPAAAGTIIALVMIQTKYWNTGGLALDNKLLQGFMLIGMILISLLMVSNIRFRTFKDLNLSKYGPMYPLVGLAALFALFMARPQEFLFFVAVSYLGLGLIEGGIIIRRRERELRDEIKQAKRQRRIQRKLEKKKVRLARKQDKENKKSSVRAIK